MRSNPTIDFSRYWQRHLGTPDIQSTPVMGDHVRKPIELRLAAVEKWRRERFERALARRDLAEAGKAAQLYTAVSAKANWLALATVTPYRDLD